MSQRKGRKKVQMSIETEVTDKSSTSALVANVNKATGRRTVASKVMKVTKSPAKSPKMINKRKSQGKAHVEMANKRRRKHVASATSSSQNSSEEIQRPDLDQVLQVVDGKLEEDENAQNFETSFIEGEAMIQMGVDTTEEQELCPSDEEMGLQDDEIVFNTQENSQSENSNNEVLPETLSEEDKQKRIKQIDMEMEEWLLELKQLMNKEGLKESVKIVEQIMGEDNQGEFNSNNN